VNPQIKPDQIKGLGLAVASCVVFGGVGWIGWSALQEALGEAQAFAERKSVPRVAAAVGHPGGAAKISQETRELANLNQTARQRLEATVRTWQDSWRETSGEGEDWSTDPGKWKDKLIETRSTFLQQSRESNGGVRVSFPDDFYLSLGQFQQKSPSPAEVPDLARQLMVARRLIEILILAKRDAKEAYPTPCLFRTLERIDSAPEQEASLKPPPGRPAPPKSSLARMTFRLQIDSSPEVLFEFVRGLEKDPWLFLIQELVVENEQTQFPSRSEIRKKFESPNQTNPEPGNAAVRPKLLEVLAGKEKVQSTLQIESIGWPRPVSPPSSSRP
jgi:hypothetical protein